MQQMLAEVKGLNMDFQTSPVVPSSHIVKKILRLDIPKDGYPNVRSVCCKCNLFYLFFTISTNYLISTYIVSV
jgi:hypothetical protein